MSPDDSSAAWAHQAELEQRRYEEERALLENDPGYLHWLDSLNLNRTGAEHEH